MSLYLLKTITDTAKASFGESTKENVEAWVDHWFRTAETIRLDALNEGLILTAQEIDGIVRQQAKFSGRPYPIASTPPQDDAS